MRKVTDFLDIPVISSKDSKVLGIISAVLCEKRLKSVEFFVFENLYDVNSSKLIFRSRNAKLKNNDCLVLSNNLCIQKLEDAPKELVDFPIGEKVFLEGKDIGTALDITFDDTRKNTISLITENGDIPINSIASVSENGITLSPKKYKKIIIEKPETNFKIELFENKEEENTINDVFVQKIPSRVICNYRFLIGRILTQNIYNFQHQLILKKGVLISIDDIMTAHKNNKLIDLTLFSKP